MSDKNSVFFNPISPSILKPDREKKGFSSNFNSRRQRKKKKKKITKCVWFQGQNNKTDFGVCSQTQFNKTSLVIVIDKINFIWKPRFDEMATSSIYMRLKILVYALQQTWH